MKPAKNVDDLAASLTRANSTPLVPPPPAPAEVVAAPPAAAKKKAAGIDTVQMTLRPPRTLYAAYVDMAAERSKREGRTISAQEIMIEILKKAQA